MICYFATREGTHKVYDSKYTTLLIQRSIILMELNELDLQYSFVFQQFCFWWPLMDIILRSLKGKKPQKYRRIMPIFSSRIFSIEVRTVLFRTSSDLSALFLSSQATLSDMTPHCQQGLAMPAMRPLIACPLPIPLPHDWARSYLAGERYSEPGGAMYYSSNFARCYFLVSGFVRNIIVKSESYPTYGGFA